MYPSIPVIPFDTIPLPRQFRLPNRQLHNMTTAPTDMPELLYESHPDDPLMPSDDHLRLALAQPTFRVYGEEDGGIRDYGWVTWLPIKKSHTTIFLPRPGSPPNGPPGPASTDPGWHMYYGPVDSKRLVELFGQEIPDWMRQRFTDLDRANVYRASRPKEAQVSNLVISLRNFHRHDYLRTRRFDVHRSERHGNFLGFRIVPKHDTRLCLGKRPDRENRGLFGGRGNAGL
jgi:hypothetical protein